MKSIPLFIASLVLLLPAGQIQALSDHTARDHHMLVAKGVQWQSLSRDEKAFLKKHRKNWPNYSSEKQEKLHRGLERYNKLSPEKQRAIQRKQQQYMDLSPEERRQLRKQYQQKKHK